MQYKQNELIDWLIQNPALGQQVLTIDEAKLAELVGQITDNGKIIPALASIPVTLDTTPAPTTPAPDLKTQPDEPQTHQIVRMQRDATKNSQSPMWRCVTEAGEKVNVFSHDDPDKDSFALFTIAGYGAHMGKMKQDEVLTWSKHPIEVQMRKDGKFWNILSVTDRNHGEPDGEPFKADNKSALESAVAWASSLSNFYVVDVESTSFDGEPIKVAVIDQYGNTLINQLIKPSPEGMKQLVESGASEVNGITPEMLEDAPSADAITEKLQTLLEGDTPVLAYNVTFDAAMLKKIGVNISDADSRCVMKQISKYMGKWDKWRIQWKPMKLVEAIVEIGETPGNAHDPLEDCLMALKLVKHMTEWESIKAPF